MSQPPALVVLAPNFPPAICGVGDYTANLLRAWPRDDGREFRCLLRPVLPHPSATRARFLPLPHATAGEGVPIRDVIPRRGPLLETLFAMGPCDLLVQYSAYGYDPRLGCPAGFCDALTAWAAAGRGLLVLMFHELWADAWPRWHPHHWVQAWHRHKLGQLTRASTAVFTTTDLSATRLRDLQQGADRQVAVTVLPAGSNIPLPAAPSPARERGLFVLFGAGLTRLRCLRAMRDDLTALANLGGLRRLVLLGINQGEAIAREEAETLREIFSASAGLAEALGERPATEIAAWLSRAEFGLSFQNEANFTKSGTLMAYLEHGLDVLSPFAGAARPAPFSSMTHPSELLAAAASVPPERGRALRAWYETHADWPLLAAAFARALRRDGAALGC